MKKSILVTGVGGSGKSTICGELKKRGYSAYDIENMDGLFQMLNKKTGKVFEGFDDDDLEKVKDGDWVCDVGKLRKLIENEKNDLAFYCGTASNLNEILPLFDVVILLKSSPEIIRRRLSSRKVGDFGRTSEIQDWIMSWKDWSEKEVEEKGAIVVDANGEPGVVTDKVLKIVTAEKIGE